MNLKVNIFLVLLTTIFLPILVQAQEHVGRVLGVTDGNTITLLDPSKHQIKVRLAEIDTPESAQPYGNRAKQELSKLVFGKTITLKVHDTDRYGRIVARVYVDTLDVNAEMVRRGAAWVYRKYARDHGLYVLEDQARQAKVGLWSLTEAERVPPWEWRNAKQRPSKDEATIPAYSQTPQHSTGQGFTCAGKTKCGQMTSCAEAYFYLNQCGLTSLDRDKNGIPCESICR